MRPNVLIVHTDQQSCWSLSAYGGNLVHTPNVDRLAEEGALLTQFFTNSAVCTPSRGCLLTGRYPEQHGAHRNNLPLGRDQTTLAHVLGDAGYDTGYIGKWHLDGAPRPGWVHPDRAMGFQDARYMFNRGHWKRIEDLPMEDCQPTVFPYDHIGDGQTYTTDWLTNKAFQFVERPRNGPFFLMLSLPDPHTPFTVREPYATMYDPEVMPIPQTFDQADGPAWLREARARSPYAPGRADRRATLRRNLAQYCGEVKLIDDCVGRLLECLERKGVLDDTIVVFTTDHGEYMGEHGLLGKNMMYEPAYRIPFVVRYPHSIPAGTVVAHLISTVDVLPTIAGLLTLPAPDTCAGRNASGLLRGQEVSWRDEIQIHHSSQRLAGIFTPEHELVLGSDGEGMLFDREIDPLQMRNLYDEAGLRVTRGELHDRMLEHHSGVGSPQAAWLRALKQESK